MLKKENNEFKGSRALVQKSGEIMFQQTSLQGKEVVCLNNKR